MKQFKIMKAVEQYFPMVLLIIYMLHKVILSLEPGYPRKRKLASNILSCGARNSRARTSLKITSLRESPGLNIIITCMRLITKLENIIYFYFNTCWR